MFIPELLHIVSYKLHNLRIENIVDSEVVDNCYFKVDNIINLGFNEEHSLVKAVLEISIDKLSETDDSLQAKSNIVIEFVFQVDNFSDLHKINEEGLFVVNKILTTNIAAIAYSTTRGLLLDKFRDSAFDEFVLPIIDVNKDIITNSQS